MKNNIILKQRPKIILFDWDDTLIDSGALLESILNETVQELGIENWDRNIADKYKHYSSRESFPIVFGDNWRDVRSLYYKKIQAREISTMVNPFPESLSLLQHFLEQNIAMSVVSNKQGPTLRKEVLHLNWQGYFNKIIGATDAERDKPWPDPVHLALDGRDVKFGDVWFVGDSVIDVQCADATGCVPILYGSKAGMQQRLAELKLNYIHAKDHIDLIKLYNNLIP